ncbi:MAG: DsrE family protein [Anaerolineaceae bacterium]|nr:DsrE family protein [Anaerolineaceae bacterium]
MSNPTSGIVILVTNDGMGKADTTLQHKLLQTYLTLLNDHNMLPAAICFYTDGVKLVVDGSPVLDLLKALEAKNVRLIVCSTCLNYFGLVDKVKVGIVGGMTDILEAQWQAEKVITI